MKEAILCRRNTDRVVLGVVVIYLMYPDLGYVGWKTEDEVRDAEQGKTGVGLLCQGRKLTYCYLAMESDRVPLYLSRGRSLRRIVTVRPGRIMSRFLSKNDDELNEGLTRSGMDKFERHLGSKKKKK